jgi:TolB protein
MNADGTGVTQKTFNLGDNWQPAWSPDGTRIVFRSNQSGNEEIWILDGGGGQAQITTTAAEEMQPAWSPDGSKIAFARGTGLGSNVDIWTMNPDGSGEVQLTHAPGEDAQPDWSPDSTQIVFDTDRTGTHDVWRMSASGLSETAVTSGGDYDDDPDWGPSLASVGGSTELIIGDTRDGSWDHTWVLAVAGTLALASLSFARWLSRRREAA